MTNTTFWATLLLASALTCVACKSNRQTPEQSNNHASVLNESLIHKNDTQSMPTEAEINIAKATVQRLLPNFRYSKDEFDGVETYIHKIYKETKTTIFAGISNGTLIDRSHYFGKNWIFHDCFYVKIGEYTVTIVASETKHKVWNNNLIYESLEPIPTLLGVASCFISSNPDKDVRVRLVGSAGRHDFILDKKVHKAICQTVDLIDALDQLKIAGIDPSTITNIKPAKTP